MFVWGQPLDVKTAADVCGISKQEAYACFKELQEEYEQEGRGLRVREVNGAFQFVTLQDNADYIERLCTPVKTKTLIAVSAGGTGDHCLQAAGDEG